jgi:D-cysteine desulfhydrase
MSSYKRNKADLSHIVSNFQGADFEPRLETYIDVDQYIEKILEHAERFEYWSDGELAGLVAIYCNDLKTREAFITMVSVMSKYEGKGIAKDLLNQAIDYCRELDFKKIKLEVRKTNIKAKKIYEKFGFRQFESNDTSIMMQLEL